MCLRGKLSMRTFCKLHPPQHQSFASITMVRNLFVNLDWEGELDVSDHTTTLEVTKCPNEVGVELSNVWMNRKSIKKGGRNMISYSIALWIYSVAVQETQCPSPIAGLTFSIAYRGHGPNIVYMPKYGSNFPILSSNYIAYENFSADKLKVMKLTSLKYCQRSLVSTFI